MKEEEIIIKLIQQELKYTQLMTGLLNIGFEANEAYNLGIIDLVAELMHIPKDNSEDLWCDIYFSFMRQSMNYSIYTSLEDFRPLAEKCYLHLKAKTAP